MEIQSLEHYRQEIDSFDRALLDCLAKRVKICEAIAQYKKAHDIPMMQPDRVKQVLKNTQLMAESYGLRAEFIQKLYSIIHAEIFELENKIIDAHS